MKLERYKDKKETRKKVMLISLTVVTLVTISMVLFKSFANFRQTVSFTIMSGKVKYKKKGKELGTDIKPSVDENGNGLFEVSHTSPTGWDKTEYRYAGPNPNNYVYFNCSDLSNQNANTCELWRIIGKVNVKTSENTIEQRLKIIRDESIGYYAWDKNVGYTNDWTKSALKDMLNEGYYFGLSNVTCYTGAHNSSAYQNTCNFSSNPKGLTSKARNMIDNQVIWTLGGWSTNQIGTDVMYEKERGFKTGSNDQYEKEWTEKNDSSNHRGVGLMYPSELEL